MVQQAIFWINDDPVHLRILASWSPNQYFDSLGLAMPQYVIRHLVNIDYLLLGAKPLS